MSKTSNQPRGCMFCGKTPRTEEELWPEWMRKLDPKVGPDSHLLVNTLNVSDDPYGFVPEEKSNKITGHSSRRKLKVVCAECNNNWMSGIEQQAIPILTPLIQNEPILLSSFQQRIIAKWAVLRTIVAENLDFKRPVITTEHIQKFYRKKASYDGWYVWIGKKAKGDMYYFYQRWLGRKGIRIVPGPVNRAIDPPNILAVTFGFKHLVIYVYYHPDANLQFKLLNGLEEKLSLVYPQPPLIIRFLNDNKISWGSVAGMDDKDLYNLTENLQNNIMSDRKPRG